MGLRRTPGEFETKLHDKPLLIHPINLGRLTGTELLGTETCFHHMLNLLLYLPAPKLTPRSNPSLRFYCGVTGTPSSVDISQ